MKKITFLMMFLAVTLGYAQVPTDNATAPPARDAGDVISIFSGVYTDVAGVNYNPNWGQAGFGSANTAFDPGTGDLVLAYPNFNYQGIDFNATIPINAMEFLHVDIWVNGTFNPNIYVISSGAEIANPITNTGAGSWISVDIPVAGITGNLSSAIQFKFDNGNGSTDAIYVDNLYFWKTASDPATDATLSDLQIDGATIPGFSSATTEYTYPVAAGTTVVPVITSVTTSNANATFNLIDATTIPGMAFVTVTASDGTTSQTYTVSIVAEGPSTAAPTPPGRPAADVISILSDAYNDISVDTYDTPWCPGTTTPLMIEGNTLHKITGLGCEGIDFQSGRFDGTTEMTRFHMDIWTETDLQDKSFNIKFSDWAGGSGEVGAYEYSATNANILTPGNEGTWISIDLPLSAFNVINGVDGTDFVQFVITSNLGTVYYDNLYLHKNTVLSNTEFNLESVSVSPNPTKNNWNVKTSNGQNITAVEVYDNLGKQVLNAVPNASEFAINASELKDGIYLAKIVSNTGSTTVKLVKN